MGTPASRLSCVVLLLTTSAGCSHFFESRAIERFAASLREENLEGLKASTTADFAEKALRTTSALEDFKILRLPDGKITIVEVEELSPTHKRVTVQVGDGKKGDSSPKKEVFYELVRDGRGKWVIDDVYLKQKKQGVTAFKSVTEQMDLLLTVREFLDAWDGGDRERVLGIVSLELRASLEQLPPAYLAALTHKVAGERMTRGTFKPQAQLEDELAVVRLPRKAGETVLTLSRRDDRWQVKDIALDSKDEKEQIPSVHKLAIAVNTCTAFLDAYDRCDKPALAELCDADFYEGSLVVANLKQVVLPSPQLTDHQLEAQLSGNRADFLLQNGAEVVQLEFRREDASDPDAPPQYKVREVTIFELESRQEKRLSALFTSHEMLQVFAQALADRDLDHLRHSATQDFATRVWHRLNAATVQGLPLDMFNDPQVEVVNTAFQGSLTRVEVRQGGRMVTYLLREERGRFFVDDVLWHQPGLPASVKQTLELLVPVKNFAAAITLGRDPAEQPTVLEMLQETCSPDFNRMVWQQTEFVPNSGLSADTFLEAPLRSITISDDQVLVKLGNDNYGALVLIRKQGAKYVVDELQLIAGPAESDRIEVKKTMRNLLATGKAVRPVPLEQEVRLAAPIRNRSPIQQAVHEEPAGEAPRAVWPENDPIDIGPVAGPDRFRP